MYNDNDAKKRYSKDLEKYILENTDLSDSDLSELREIVSEISNDEFEYRMTTIADFFIRSKKDIWKNRIQNEPKYARSIINSASFFENQNWVSNIPNVEETSHYLEQRRLDDLVNPGVSKETFHKNTLNVKKLYQNSEFFEFDQTDYNDERRRIQGHRDYALAFEKLDDETLKNKLNHEIDELFKRIEDCELEYVLFKNTLMNIYIFNGKEAFNRFKMEIQKYTNLTLEDLLKIKRKIT